MIRRHFIRALSGGILMTLLGVRPWRLEADISDVVPEEEAWFVYRFSAVYSDVDWRSVRWVLSRSDDGESWEDVSEGVGIAGADNPDGSLTLLGLTDTQPRSAQPSSGRDTPRPVPPP